MANADGSETPSTEAQTQDTPKFVTADDVAKIVNAAVSSHLKRQPDISKLLDERFSKFAESMQARQPTGDAAVEQPAASIKVDPELARMRQRQESLEKMLAAEKKAREDAEQARRQERAVGELQTALAKHVRPEAVGTLVKAFRGDLTWDGDDAVLPIEGGTTNVAAAIELWAKTKDASIYVPAPSQGGGGTPRPAGQRSSGSWQSKPQSQWTDAEQAEAMSEFARRNAAAGA